MPRMPCEPGEPRPGYLPVKLLMIMLLLASAAALCIWGYISLSSGAFCRAFPWQRGLQNAPRNRPFPMPGLLRWGCDDKPRLPCSQLAMCNTGFGNQSIGCVLPSIALLRVRATARIKRTHKAGELSAKDLNSSRGFCRHLWSIMNMAPGAICFAGVVCSSWSTINRSLSCIAFACLAVVCSHCRGNKWQNSRSAAWKSATWT